MSKIFIIWGNKYEVEDGKVKVVKKIRKTNKKGTTVVLSLAARALKEAGIKEGDTVEITIRKIQQ